MSCPRVATVRPRVLWGKNAPALYQGPEELVQEHGYSFSMVKTDSQLHGLPQLSPTVPILAWKSNPAPLLIDYLEQIPPWASLQDVFVHEGVASERYLPYSFMLQREGLTHRQFSAKHGRGTVAKFLEKAGLIEECIAWLQQYHPTETFSIQVDGRSTWFRTHIQVLEHMLRKLAKGLGYLDDSIKFMGDYFSAVISKNIAYAIHPTEDRFFNIRELLHLMGMPHDFELQDAKRNINHLCQNVPVNTAADWAGEVVRFCRGEAEMTPYTFLRQDNTNQTVTDSLPPQERQVKLEKLRLERPVKLEMVKAERPVKLERWKNEPRKMFKRFSQPPLEEEPSVSVVKRELYERLELRLEESPPKRGRREVVATRSSVARILEQHRAAALPSLLQEEDETIREHKNSMFKCGLCGYKTSTKSDLSKHWRQSCALQAHQGVKKYQCEGCGAKGLTTDLIRSHWQEECPVYSQQEVTQEQEEQEEQ